ncbi:hypothetical protein, partial [Flavobacterium sp. HTF]|uniref:hypothetical protein n=1 Tax=Flavobacterium sp. HTF TaxID=2170732 RepID=UPI000D5ED875
MKKINKKEVLVSTAKSIFGNIPFGGSALDELFFEYNGRIKQNRLNNFIQILADYFTKDAEINLDNIQTENFNDLFESVLRRVVQTKSELKLLRFKDILIKELNNPTIESEVVDHYLDLISTLTEEELRILYNHRHFTEEFEEHIDELNRHKSYLLSIEKQLKKERFVIGESEFQKPYDQLQITYEKKKEYVDSFTKYKKAEFYNLSTNSFMFYKQRLFSKGLLIDNGMNRIGGVPFGSMAITEFG